MVLSNAILTEYIERSDDVGSSTWGNNEHAVAHETPIAQVFTTAANFPTAMLKQIDLYISKIGSPTQSVVVELRNVSGTTHKPTTLIESKYIDVANIPASASTITSVEGWTASLSASTEYAIVIRHPTSTSSNNIWWMSQGVGAGVAYSGGKAWWSTDYGTTWAEISVDADSVDFNFSVYGIEWDSEICDYNIMCRLAGYGVSSTVTAKAVASSYAKRAEQIVNAMTRYDWTTNWSSADANSKGLVSSAAEAIAAAMMVQYNYTGYSSRFEAENIVAQLKDDANTYLEALTDDSIKKQIQS